MKRELYLLDAYALIYRGYFAFARNPRVNSKGMDTSAIYGFLLTFNDILNKAAGRYIAVAFDPKGPTFRHEAYSEYKAQREETPDAIRQGVPYIKDIIEALGVNIYEVPGYEADDVVGTIVSHADRDTMVYMVTPDKDYAQLVSDTAHILKPVKGSEYEDIGPEEVIAKYSIQSQEQMIDFLALIGDTSDNVPGCAGIGPKGASDLLMKYHDVNDIYAHIDEIKGKKKEHLINGKTSVLMSRELVTICREVPFDFNLEECRVEDRDTDRLVQIFEELEFKTFIDRYGLRDVAPSPTQKIDTPIQHSLFGDDLFAPKSENTSEINSVVQTSTTTFDTIDTIEHQYTIARTLEEIEKVAKDFREVDFFAFDTETEGLDALSAPIVGLSLAHQVGEAVYIPLPEDTNEVIRLLTPLRTLFSSQQQKIGQNLKFDIEVLSRYGITITGPLFDTMIAHYLLNPELSHSMDYMSENYLNYRPIPITDLIGPKGKKQLSMREVDIDKVAPYAAEDADITLRLFHFLSPQIEERELHSLFYDLEMPLMSVLMGMEQEGVAIDTNVLKEVSNELEKQLYGLEHEIYTSAGIEFNINSPKEVGEVLFDKLSIGNKPKKTKTGNYSTREELLLKIKSEHPVVEMILRYRGLRKLLSTYVDALPLLISPYTGRLHTTYNQTVTATGRLSSSNPNLQNIPIRTDDGREIRRAFIPLNPDREVFLSADYSQIELRLMAHLSGDESLIEAFRSGADIHASTASKIYGVPLDEVTSEQRRRAKTANFGIIYGISVFGLSQRLDIPRSEASELIDGYFNSYPAVRKYMNDVVQEAREKGYVETLLGRRRYLSDIDAANFTVRGYAERNAINAPIQGTAADIIKVAMVRIDKAFREKGLKTKMILQVHDELNFSVPTEEIEIIRGLIRTEMEGVLPDLAVPLTVEIGVGKDWLEAH